MELCMRKISIENKEIVAENVQRQGAPPATGDRRHSVRVVAAAKGCVSRSSAWARRSVVREFWEWARCKQVSLPSVKQMAESMAALRAGTSDAVNLEGQTDAPIFVLAT